VTETNIDIDYSGDLQAREMIRNCKRLKLDLRPELSLFWDVKSVAVLMFHSNQPAVEGLVDLEHAS